MHQTITNVPLAPLRHLLSTRVWNLLTRDGYTTVAQLQQALNEGLQAGDIKGLGPAAMLEIRLALDSLPTDTGPAPGYPPGVVHVTEQPASTPPAPGKDAREVFTAREMTVLLALAEAGAETGSYQGTADQDEDEAHVVLSRLRLAVRDLSSANGWSQPAPVSNYVPSQITPSPETRPLSQQPEPVPLDDEYEGYVLETPPGWGAHL